MLIADQEWYTIRLDQFEGPLDVLLRLIERAELDITTIALAQVTDQYVQYVRAMRDRDAGHMSSFLVLASRLLVIKSRALLPATPSSADDPDESADLVRQLKEYQHYKAAAEMIRIREQQGWQSFAKAPSLPNASVAHMPLLMTLDDLLSAWQIRMQLVDVTPPPVPVPAPKLLTVGDVVVTIRERLQQVKQMVFTDLLPRRSRTRVDVVVSLWAVLEMIKRRAVVASQDELFGPIVLEATTQAASDTPDSWIDDEPQ